MPTIVRAEASAEAIAKASKSIFDYNSFIHPVGSKFTIKEVKYTSHEVDGKVTDSAVLIIVLDAPDTVIYVRSFLKPRRSYKGEFVKVEGTLNDKVVSFRRIKTLDQVKDYLTKLVGKQITAKVTSYKGVNKDGDVQDIDVNGWDLVGKFPADE